MLRLGFQVTGFVVNQDLETKTNRLSLLSLLSDWSETA
jgi:hypothetical protein